MRHKLLLMVAVFASVPVFAGMASADGDAVRHGMRHHHRARSHMLPPEIPYRDPRVDLRPRNRPDFLIHAYLPRFTNVPIYNEPPAHFPQR